ncbi:TolB-like translocation protein [Halegenticoccus soli]|uniref:hypothetical protein n=1 Tax=Halegenticoccus soli TaxID=1985678 RepID=UPI000C6DF953|nr:hypothetical protein [Halegenticoccus soli]
MPTPDRETLDKHFPRYREFDPAVPTWCVTPDETGYIHRFFETSPISPSGRYLAVTKLPCEDRLPNPGEIAEISVVDLLTGERETVAKTTGWDTQMGAHLQWGESDAQLFFNDMNTDTWTPYGVKLDPTTGDQTRLEGTIYDVTADGSKAASPNLLGTRVTQDGYGVVVPDDALSRYEEADDDDGVYVTDTETGECELVASVADIVEALDLDGSAFGPGTYYVFHVMWNPAGDQLMLNFRYWPDEGGYWRWVPHLVTLDADGSNVRLCLPVEAWNRGGHHICWRPDGERITMNLRLEEDGPMRLVSVDPDGGGYEVLSDTIVGGGHPAPHADGHTFVTDAYQHEDVAEGDGTIPLRLVDVAAQTERTALRIRTDPPFTGPHDELRVDPHPVWDPEHRFVTVNACPNGGRQVFVADLGEFVDSGAG